MKNFRFQKRYKASGKQRIIPGYGLCCIDENLTDDMVEAAINAGMKGVFTATEPDSSQTDTSNGNEENNGGNAQ
jgi:hypothetical protein